MPALFIEPFGDGVLFALYGVLFLFTPYGDLLAPNGSFFAPFGDLLAPYGGFFEAFGELILDYNKAFFTTCLTT